MYWYHVIARVTVISRNEELVFQEREVFTDHYRRHGRIVYRGRLSVEDRDSMGITMQSDLKSMGISRDMTENLFAFFKKCFQPIYLINSALTASI